jgi:ABC-type multidrug transport system ATPase subunit
MDAKREFGVTENMANSTSDLEKNHIGASHLTNDLVEHVMWKNLNVMVKDRTTKQPISILDNANGLIRAGEMLAIMGPSGSGKTTLLNTLAHRVAAEGATTTGEVFLNGQKVNLETLADLSSYVEQEDALTGCLTVQETMKFAAGLALSK